MSPPVRSIVSFIMKGRINQNRFLIGEAMLILIGRIIEGGD